MKKVLYATAALLLFVLAPQCSNAQNGRTGVSCIPPPGVGADGIETSSPNSPSIASFSAPDPQNVEIWQPEKFCCAFSFKSGTGPTVGISVSTNTSATSAGTWTVLRGANTPLAKPKWNQNGTRTTLDYMDDPQVVSDGRSLFLVVRAYGGNEADYAGSYYGNLPGAIPTKSGIFICESTNGGSTWGYDDGGGFVADTWGTIAQNENYGSSSAPTTLEYPRVALRTDYQTYPLGLIGPAPNGYVVWEKKQFTKSVVGGEADFYPSTSTAIGIRAFDATGKLLATTTGGAHTNYISFPSGCTLSSAPPERASIAIAPDRSIWLGFMTVQVSADDNTRNGVQKPPMKIWVARGTLSSGSTQDFSFVDCPQEVDPATNKLAYGYYDKTRGFLYLGIPETSHNLGIDLATGPQVQVASESPAVLQPDYHVGALYIYNDEQNAYENPTTEYYFRNHIGFNSARERYNGSVSNLSWIYSNPVELESKSAGWSADAAGDPSEQGLNFNTFFFPCLKYVVTRDPLLIPAHFKDGYGYFEENANTGRDIHLLNSYFVCAYMAFSTSVDPQTGDISFDNTEVQTGMSPDNESFAVTKADGSKAPLIKYVENPLQQASSQIGDPINDEWGTKLDVTSCAASPYQQLFDVHPVYKDISPKEGFGASSWQIRTNTGCAVLVKPYIENYPSLIPEAFPKGYLTRPSSTGSYAWGTYAYFDFNNLSSHLSDFPSSIGQPTSVTIDPYGLCYPSGIVPSPASAIAPALYYGDFKSCACTSGVELGTVQQSDLRGFVTTGNLVHGVFDKGNTVRYSIKAYAADNRSAGSPGIFYQPIPEDWGSAEILDQPGSGVLQVRPNITLYQQGASTDATTSPTGVSAIAVTWTEIAPSTADQSKYVVSVKLKTREFDAVRGYWNVWSPTYTVHSHLISPQTKVYPYPNVSFPDNPDDGTTVVCAALTKNSSCSDALTGGVSSLVGWEVIWSSPALTVNGGDAFGSAKPDPNHPLTAKDYQTLYNTGLYSRAWLRPASGNASWGSYPAQSAAQWLPAHSNGSLDANDILKVSRYISATMDPSDRLNPIAFPTAITVDSKVNKGTGILPIEVSFSGQEPCYYPTNVYETLLSFDVSGAISNASSILNVSAKTPLPSVPWPKWRYIPSTIYKDRNPSVTVNSRGQRFLAFERMTQQGTWMLRGNLDGSGFSLIPPVWRSSVVVANTIAGADWLSTTNKALWTTVYTVKAGSYNWEWLLDPSITGYPKTSLLNMDQNELDGDLAGTEVQWWQKNSVTPSGSTALLNQIDHRKYYEPRKAKAGVIGQWDVATDRTHPPYPGVASQLSFGYYNTGFGVPDPNYSAITPIDGNAYAFSNAVADPNRFASYEGGSYKIGVYDSELAVSSYRTESLNRDSGTVKFVWGDVFVEDTTGWLPKWQVVLHSGQADSNGYATVRELRDSIFRTEVFDWPVGAQINYYRGFWYPYDTTGSVQAGLAGSSALYTMRLIHSNGQIDTVERFAMSMDTASSRRPGIIHIANGNNVRDSVYLDVVADLNGFEGEDSTSDFSVEYGSDIYPSYCDSTVVNSSQHLTSVQDQCLAASGPYPNPTAANGIPSVLTSDCHLGSTLTAQVYDYLGGVVGSPVTITANGGWQRLYLPLPAISGTYYVVITCAGNVVSLPWSVTY